MAWSQERGQLFSGLGNWTKLKLYGKECRNQLSRGQRNDIEAFLQVTCGNCSTSAIQKIIQSSTASLDQLFYEFVHREHGQELKCRAQSLDEIDVNVNRGKAIAKQKIILNDVLEKVELIKQVDRQIDSQFPQFKNRLKEPGLMSGLMQFASEQDRKIQGAYGSAAYALFGVGYISAHQSLERWKADKARSEAQVPPEFRELLKIREGLKASIWNYQQPKMKSYVDALIRGESIPNRDYFLGEVVNEMRGALQDESEFWRKGQGTDDEKRTYLDKVSQMGMLNHFLSGGQLGREEEISRFLSMSGIGCRMGGLFQEGKEAYENLENIGLSIATLATMGLTSEMALARMTTTGARVVNTAVALSDTGWAAKEFLKSSKKCKELNKDQMNLGVCKSGGASSVEGEIKESNCYLQVAFSSLALAGGLASFRSAIKSIVRLPSGATTEEMAQVVRSRISASPMKDQGEQLLKDPRFMERVGKYWKKGCP